MAKGIYLGHDQVVANWAFKTFHRFPMQVNRAFGIVENKDDKYNPVLVGAILFQNFNGNNVELSYYGPNTFSLGIARAMARVVLGEFKASRVTIVTSKKNKRIMRALQKFGFKLEGVQRRYYGDRDCYRNTGVRFVMFREDIEKLAAVRPRESKSKVN